MKWEEIRNLHTNRWVLVEVLKAESKDGQRLIQDMAVISEYTNSTDAWKGYKTLHLQDPSRELYIFHTINEKVHVEEQRFIGIRGRA